MPLDQLRAFVEQLDFHGGVTSLKVCGGEPLLHPQVTEAYEILVQAAERGVIRRIKMQTNGTVPRPNLRPSACVIWKSSKPAKKVHLPYEWSPSDLGLPVTAPCSHPFRCGYAFDTRGWMLCSPGIMIARLFGHEYLYRTDMPTKPWGLELCRHCIYAAPEDFRRTHVKHLAAFTPEMKMASKSWFDALRLAGAEPEGPLDTRPF